MAEKIKVNLKCESGVVQIVEASFVFPVMFIILFFLIYMGNAHYIKAQMESLVEQEALAGAAYCADPFLESIEQGNTELSDMDIKPYRYIFGGMDDIESDISGSVKSNFEQSSSFFKNMTPKLKTSGSEIASFNNYVVYSTFSVEIEYAIQFPIRFFGSDSIEILNIKSRAEVPVSDTTEFIRNTDMAVDVFSGTKLGKSISDTFDKINNFISGFTNK